jgi:hypothetical protein
MGDDSTLTLSPRLQAAHRGRLHRKWATTPLFHCHLVFKLLAEAAFTENGRRLHSFTVTSSSSCSPRPPSPTVTMGDDSHYWMSRAAKSLHSKQYPVSLSSISHQICTVGDGQPIADATRNMIAPQPELYNRVEVAQILAAFDATAASVLLLPSSLLLLQQLAVVAQQLAALDATAASVLLFPSSLPVLLLQQLAVVAQQLAALDATAASVLFPSSLPVLLLQQLAVVAQQLAALEVWLTTSQSNGRDATLEQGVCPRANGDGHGGERCRQSRQTGGQADELTETWTEREKSG